LDYRLFGFSGTGASSRGAAASRVDQSDQLGRSIDSLTQASDAAEILLGCVKSDADSLYQRLATDLLEPRRVAALPIACGDGGLEDGLRFREPAASNLAGSTWLSSPFQFEDLGCPDLRRCLMQPGEIGLLEMGLSDSLGRVDDIIDELRKMLRSAPIGPSRHRLSVSASEYLSVYLAQRR
jgi:hypothetical protein